MAGGREDSSTTTRRRRGVNHRVKSKSEALCMYLLVAKAFLRKTFSMLIV